MIVLSKDERALVAEKWDQKDDLMLFLLELVVRQSPMQKPHALQRYAGRIVRLVENRKANRDKFISDFEKKVLNKVRRPKPASKAKSP